MPVNLVGCGVLKQGVGARIKPAVWRKKILSRYNVSREDSWKIHKLLKDLGIILYQNNASIVIRIDFLPILLGESFTDWTPVSQEEVESAQLHLKVREKLGFLPIRESGRPEREAILNELVNAIGENDRRK